MIEIKGDVNYLNLIKKYTNLNKKLDDNLNHELKKIINDMRNHIILGMQKTPRANWSHKKVGGKWHYPSLPNQFPAIDTGSLVNSILTFSNNLEAKLVVKERYGIFLENGTKKMDKRPFIKPTIDAIDYQKRLNETIQKTINGEI